METNQGRKVVLWIGTSCCFWGLCGSPRFIHGIHRHFAVQGQFIVKSIRFSFVLGNIYIKKSLTFSNPRKNKTSLNISKVHIIGI